MNADSRESILTNTKAATKFLDALFDKSNPKVCFQVFVDRKDAEAYPWHQHGTLSEMLPRLDKANAAGCGIFFTVNKTDGEGRSAENIVECFAVVADFDGTALPDSWPIEPHIIVETSPGKFHVYWLIERTTELAEWRRLQARLWQFYGSDHTVIDLPRVFRLPGFYHQKGEPFRSKLIKLDADLPRYMLAKIEEAHPVENFEEPGEAKSREAPRIEEPKGGWDKKSAIAQAIEYLTNEAEPAIEFEGKGGGNQTYKVACRVRDFEISLDKARELMTEHYSPRCEPPWDGYFNKFEEIIGNAYRYAKGNAGSARKSTPEEDFDGVEVDPEHLNPPGKKKKKKKAQAQAYSGETLDDNWMDGLPSVLDYQHGRGSNPATNAQMFLRNRCYPLIVHEDVFYTYHKGCWHPLPASKLAIEIRKTDPSGTFDGDYVLRMIKAIRMEPHVDVTARPFEWINPPEDAPDEGDLVLFKDKILDVLTGRTFDLDQNYFATGLPEMKYDPDAECPRWHNFLGEVLDHSFHPTLQQWFGYCLVTGADFQKILALIGAPRGGKGTTANVLTAVIGRSLVRATTLSDFSSEFGLQGITDQKSILIGDAHDSKDGRNHGRGLDRLKGISGQDAISVNRKNLPILTNVQIRAKITLLGNKMPKFLDESGALAMRVLLIEFERSFFGRENKNLLAELLEELPGIANWAVQGLRELRKAGKFTVGAKGLKAAKRLKEAQSPALRFSNECLDVTGDKTDFVGTKRMFAAYRKWVDDEHLSYGERRAMPEFVADLLAAIGYSGVKHAHPYINRKTGTRKRGLLGCKLKPPYDINYYEDA